MSWGTELWDRFDNIAEHTQKGLDFCERYQHFIRDRSAIEQEYATKLKKLVKAYNYQPKKKQDDGSQFTTVLGFQTMIKELYDMAGQHETIAENLNTSVVKDLQSFMAELKQERKKYLQDGTRQMSSLQVQLQQLERAKKQYEKAFRDAEKAQDAYKKADADINLSRAEVEKAKNTSISKQQHCEDCKNDYASELQKTNQAQQGHYYTLMPQIFQHLQDMDERRVKRLAEYIRQCAEVEKNVLPIISTCIDGTFKGADAINASGDSQIVIGKYRSGLSPPGDIPFEDLSNNQSSDNHVAPSNTPKNATLRADSYRGTSADRKGKQRKGLFALFSNSKQNEEAKEDFSDLAPAQQQKKLAHKVEELKAHVTRETAERNGLLNLRDAYVRNPAHGDPASVDKQLEDNAQRLDKLRQELQKFEKYLADSGSRLSGHSASDDSITHSMSELSVGSQQQGSAPGTPKSFHQVPAQDNDQRDGGPRGSPDSGVDNTQHAGFAEQDSFDDGLEEFPVIGSCRALYSFEASNEGSIPMIEGEIYEVLETDQGDGWTRVRKVNGEEGFVPTSYIDCNLSL